MEDAAQQVCSWGKISRHGFGSLRYALCNRLVHIDAAGHTAMKILPHVKLTKHEFIMLRSLAKQSWQSTDPVVWRMNREWRATHAMIKDARAVAEQLWKRGLVDAVPLLGFSPLSPCETVKLYSLNDRGEALLLKANSSNTQRNEVIPHLMQLRPSGSIWGRILHSLRRRRAAHSQATQRQGD